MENPAKPADLVSRGYASVNETVEQTRLDEAWRALIAEIPSIPARMQASSLDTGLVIDVVAAAALRVLRNPEGRVKGAGSIDDYREEWDLADSSNDTYFTSAELRRLALPQTAAGSMRYF
jgi:hypothetical protein